MHRILELATLTGLLATTTATVLPRSNSNNSSSPQIVNIPLDQPKRILRKDLYGYSIEPSAVGPYVTTNLSATILQSITDIIGVPPPIRIGGTVSDQTVFVPEEEKPSSSKSESEWAVPNATTVDHLYITRDWFEKWTGYFPDGTDLVYTANFGNTSANWDTAMKEVQALMEVLGGSTTNSYLSRIELGNEVDHYVNEGWRTAGSWGTKEYTAQWKKLAGQIVNSKFYRRQQQQKQKQKPRFQAGVLADPPNLPDMQDETDDFDIVNLTTHAGLINPSIIDTYAVHLYPQSNCDPKRRARLSLDLLSNHDVVLTNLSQYIPQVAAAEKAGGGPRLILGETNSASCSGKSGVSDTFGAALWAVDYTLAAANWGLEQVYYHQGHQSEYSSFTPLPYEYQGENLTAGVRANFYAHLFLAYVLAGNDHGNSNSSSSNNNTDELLLLDRQISALEGANSSDFSGYAIYSNNDNNIAFNGSSDSTGSSLEKLVFIDFGIWNSTTGSHNPSTLTSTDSHSSSGNPNTRPHRHLQINTPWTPGTVLELVRLQGPGTNAKSGVNVSGVTVDPRTGSLRGRNENKPGSKRREIVTVGKGGSVGVDIVRAGAVLIQKG